jgi:hypothetical protein
LGIKLMVAKLQTCTDVGTTAAEQLAIRNAITTAWSDNDNVLDGPDLVDFTSDDGFHIQTDVKLQDVAEAWWAAIDAALFTATEIPGIFFISGSSQETVGITTKFGTRTIQTRTPGFAGNVADRFDDLKYYGHHNQD